MAALLQTPEFWKAMVSLAWPSVVLIVALKFRHVLETVFRRDRLTIKVAGMEISLADATEQTGKSLSDLQERVARLEKGAADTLPSQSTIAASDPNIRSNIEASVLWVDDYPSNNAFIIEKIDSNGIRVRKELSTDSGLKALNNDSFNVIISDLGRVEGGKENPFAGLEFIREVRSKKFPHPILIFSGTRGLENKERLINAGATAVTASPVDVFGFVEKYIEM